MNRWEDWPIIESRKRILRAQDDLATRPSAERALDIQRLQRAWKEHKALTLVSD